MKAIKVGSVASILVVASAASASADSTVKIDRNVLRQMVQLSVAYTQARISYTSPPYPVQFVPTNSFAPTGQARVPLGPFVSPSASKPNNNPLFMAAQRLPAGTYSVVATPSAFTLSPVPQGYSANNLIPASLSPLLPASSTMGMVTVHSILPTGGNVTVRYTFNR